MTDLSDYYKSKVGDPVPWPPKDEIQLTALLTSLRQVEHKLDKVGLLVSFTFILVGACLGILLTR